MKTLQLSCLAGLLLSVHAQAVQVPETSPGPGVSLVQENYLGWEASTLGNRYVALRVAPAIGGRVIQYSLGKAGFFWINPALAGQAPTADGVGPGESWLNYGGDKLWPAPQGWDNDQQWPGPPDGVLDVQPYVLERLPAPPGEAAIRLTSRPDPRSGIRLSRVIRLGEDSTRVRFEATMENIDVKPRRWGIWAHTQLAAVKSDGSGYNPKMRAWCPINPRSQFPGGYSVIFGETNNPSFQVDAGRGLMQVNYRYQVGKIGLDSHAGWVATVNGETGAAFVQTFVFEPGKAYPDGSSVEFWHNGVGRIHAYNKILEMGATEAENPYVFESELLSPFAELQPGERYTWNYAWHACNLGGDFPVIACGDAGVVSEPLGIDTSSGQSTLKGRLGVFSPGTLRVEFADAEGRRVASADLAIEASPLNPVVLNAPVEAPATAATLRLLLIGAKGRTEGLIGDCVRLDGEPLKGRAP